MYNTICIYLKMYDKKSYVECSTKIKPILKRICLIAGVQYEEKNSLYIDFEITIKTKKELDRIFPTLYDYNLVDSKVADRRLK